MPQVHLPEPHDCSFEDIARWDAAVLAGKAETRELAAAAEISKAKPAASGRRRATHTPEPSPAGDKE